nr:Kinesin-like protein [Ipomoea batatas]GME09652.1 Kinesin-like protein [Ipomoea batatas]
MEKQVLDYVLVPLGLLVMVCYHLWLLWQIRNNPNRTVIGVNAINRGFWVRAMMEDVSKNGVLAVQTLRNNIMASTLLASTAIMLSSLIAVLMTGFNSNSDRSMTIVLGDNSDLSSCIKFFSILVCFLVAFLFNVQSIRYYSHASILVNVPYRKIMEGWEADDPTNQYRCVVTSEYVGRTVNRGSYFWSLGLRAFYFSFPLFLWIFGPIPMFLCCIVLVFMLYFLDVTVDFRLVASTPNGEEDVEIGQQLGTID